VDCPSCGHNNIAGADNCDSCNETLVDVQTQPATGLTKKIQEGIIADLEPREAISVSPDAKVSEVVKTMREKKMGCVFVAQDGRVVGIMTERDILLGVAGIKDASETEVHEVMHQDPICLGPDDPVSYAFHHMTVGGYRHLPVVDLAGGIGMVSSRDLLRYLGS